VVRDEHPFSRLRAPTCLDLPYPAGRYRRLGKEEPLLRLRAPTCLGLPTHGALSQFGFFVYLGLATLDN